MWLDALLTDMRRRAETLGHPRIRTIFFGGGTPSLLPPDAIHQAISAAATWFSLDTDVEISMEANPDSVNVERALGFRAAGVNRVSLGAQALDDALLRAVGRIHDKAAVLSAFRALRNAGFDNIGLDFIWGLPGESLGSWKAQLAEAVALNPEHLSCYGLTLEEGTPLFYERDRLSLPDEEEAAAMYLEGGELLERAGYAQYEISNYARPGRACRHNLGYWTGEDYLGLGPASVSCLGNRRMTQPSNLDLWLTSVRNGHDAAETEILGFRERAEEFVMLSLRTAEGLRLEEYRRLTGHDFFADNRPLIDALTAQNMAMLKNGRFFLTRRGMLVSNAVIEQCFETIPHEPEATA